MALRVGVSGRVPVSFLDRAGCRRRNADYRGNEDSSRRVDSTRERFSYEAFSTVTAPRVRRGAVGCLRAVARPQDGGRRTPRVALALVAVPWTRAWYHVTLSCAPQHPSLTDASIVPPAACAYAACWLAAAGSRACTVVLQTPRCLHSVLSGTHAAAFEFRPSVSSTPCCH